MANGASLWSTGAEERTTPRIVDLLAVTAPPGKSTVFHELQAIKLHDDIYVTTKKLGATSGGKKQVHAGTGAILLHDPVREKTCALCKKKEARRFAVEPSLFALRRHLLIALQDINTSVTDSEAARLTFVHLALGGQSLMRESSRKEVSTYDAAREALFRSLASVHARQSQTMGDEDYGGDKATSYSLSRLRLQHAAAARRLYVTRAELWATRERLLHHLAVVDAELHHLLDVLAFHAVHLFSDLERRVPALDPGDVGTYAIKRRGIMVSDEIPALIADLSQVIAQPFSTHAQAAVVHLEAAGAALTTSLKSKDKDAVKQHVTTARAALERAANIMRHSQILMDLDPVSLVLVVASDNRFAKRYNANDLASLADALDVFHKTLGRAGDAEEAGAPLPFLTHRELTRAITSLHEGKTTAAKSYLHAALQALTTT